jgi:hypothetical protein
VVRPGSDRSHFLRRLRHSPTSPRKCGDRRRAEPLRSDRWDSALNIRLEVPDAPPNRAPAR